MAGGRTGGRAGGRSVRAGGRAGGRERARAASAERAEAAALGARARDRETVGLLGSFAPRCAISPSAAGTHTRRDALVRRETLAHAASSRRKGSFCEGAGKKYFLRYPRWRGGGGGKVNQKDGAWSSSRREYLILYNVQQS